MKNAGKVFLVCTAMVCLPAWASDVSVGRATVQQLDDSWQVKSVEDKGVIVGGSAGGKMDSETKIFIKVSAKNELLGLLAVKATSSGLDMTNARMVYTPKCDSNADSFAQGNTGNNERYLECMRVLKPFGSESLLKNFIPQAVNVLKEEKISLPKSLRAVRTQYSNGNGSNATVIALLAPNFAGTSGEFTEALPAGIDAQLVLWAQSLQKATKGSVMSFSGKLVIPPIEFKN